MVTDAFGRGQFVQHNLIDGETTINFSMALRAFKENNSTWEKVEVVVVSYTDTKLTQ